MPGLSVQTKLAEDGNPLSPAAIDLVTPPPMAVALASFASLILTGDSIIP